jgi:hypothetical protein
MEELEKPWNACYDSGCSGQDSNHLPSQALLPEPTCSVFRKENQHYNFVKLEENTTA